MSKKILVIEDNEQNMYLVRFILQAHDYSVLEATNGNEGIQAAIENVPDLILLDIQLPVMDGYAVAKEFVITSYSIHYTKLYDYLLITGS